MIGLGCLSKYSGEPTTASLQSGPMRTAIISLLIASIQEGTPMHVLQELGGWSTPEMVQKYAHLSADHLAQWVDRRPLVAAVPSNDYVSGYSR